MTDINEMTITELRARAAEIREAVTADNADLPALEKEADAIAERIKQYDIEQRRKAIAARVASGLEGTPLPNPTADNTAEQRAQQFRETRRETISAMETRATLMSSGNLAAPTGVSGINDSVGVKVSSIIDILDSWGTTLEMTLQETTVETLKFALTAAATDDTTTKGYTTIIPKNGMEDEDYEDSVSFVGRLSGSNDPVVITIFNAIATSDLKINPQDGKESSIQVTLTGHYDPDDPETPPFKIYYPKKAEV